MTFEKFPTFPPTLARGGVGISINKSIMTKAISLQIRHLFKIFTRRNEFYSFKSVEASTLSLFKISAKGKKKEIIKAICV